MQYCSFFKKIRNKKPMPILCLSLLALLSHYSHADLGDGPRAYLPPPINTNVFILYGMQVSGNSMFDSGIVIPNLDLDIDLLVAQYTRTMEIADRYVAFTAVQPQGRLSSKITLPNAPNFKSETESEGLGDTQLLISAGLYGLPPLTLATYRDYKPELVVGGLVRIVLPTGEYDEDKSANLGANRYSLQLGSPITFAFGESFVDPRLTTLDLLPTITLYSDNDDPFNADKTSQKPLFKFESHVTHNFNPAFWASIDSVYSYGGATKTDGQSDDNRQGSFNMGATLGFQFSAEFGLKLTHGKTIDHNDDGWDGDFARLVLTYNQL